MLGAGNEADISNTEADAADIIAEVIDTNAAAAATTTTDDDADAAADDADAAADDADAAAAGADAGDVKILMVLVPKPFFLERLSPPFGSFSSPFCRGEVDASRRWCKVIIARSFLLPPRLWGADHVTGRLDHATGCPRFQLSRNHR